MSETNGSYDLEAPRLRLVTAMGDLLIELYPVQAPKSCEAFLRFVDAGLLDGATFWRSVKRNADESIVQIEVIQARAEGHDDERGIAHEPTSLTHLRHVDGVVSLARGEVGTGSPSDFFICVGDQPDLDHGGRRNADGQGFAAFGRVVQGGEVVTKIHALPTGDQAAGPEFAGQTLINPVVISSVRKESP